MHTPLNRAKEVQRRMRQGKQDSAVSERKICGPVYWVETFDHMSVVHIFSLD